MPVRKQAKHVLLLLALVQEQVNSVLFVMRAQAYHALLDALLPDQDGVASFCAHWEPLLLVERAQRRQEELLVLPMPVVLPFFCVVPLRLIVLALCPLVERAQRRQEKLLVMG
jgi:hypothetical protein